MYQLTNKVNTSTFIAIQSLFENTVMSKYNNKVILIPGPIVFDAIYIAKLVMQQSNILCEINSKQNNLGPLKRILPIKVESLIAITGKNED